MSRSEEVTKQRAIQEQLLAKMLKRKNDTWGNWLAATNSGTGNTAELIAKREVELQENRDEYEKALRELNLNNQFSIENSQEQTEDTPTTPQRQSTPRRGGTQNTQTTKPKPSDDVLKGAENLPQNRPDLGINRAKNIDGIQNKNDSENTQKPGQSTQNMSNEIREAQQEQGIEEQNEFRQNEESVLDDQYLQEALSEIESVLAVHDIDLTEFLKGLPGYSEYEKLQSIIAESKNVQYTFPVFLLATATLVDIIEWINLAPGAGLITLVILSVIKYTTLVPILIISTFGDAGIVSKMIMKRILFRKAEKKGFFLALSPLAEFIPLIGSFWPGTLLFYLWLTNAKTTAGLILVELAKIVNKVPGDISK